MSPYIPWVGLAALVVTLGVWGFYLASIARNTVAKEPWGSAILLMLSAGAGGYAIVAKPALVTIAPGAMSITMGALFLYLLSQRVTPVGDIAIKVGDRLLPFQAKNADGSAFSSASLDGNRILLKFFRGSW